MLSKMSGKLSVDMRIIMIVLMPTLDSFQSEQALIVSPAPHHVDNRCLFMAIHTLGDKHQ
jgi:hypothetical protein